MAQMPQHPYSIKVNDPHKQRRRCRQNKSQKTSTSTLTTSEAVKYCLAYTHAPDTHFVFNTWFIMFGSVLPMYTRDVRRRNDKYCVYVWNFPLKPQVRLLVGRSVEQSVIISWREREREEVTFLTLLWEHFYINLGT